MITVNNKDSYLELQDYAFFIKEFVTNNMRNHPEVVKFLAKNLYRDIENLSKNEAYNPFQDLKSDGDVLKFVSLIESNFRCIQHKSVDNVIDPFLVNYSSNFILLTNSILNVLKDPAKEHKSLLDVAEALYKGLKLIEERDSLYSSNMTFMQKEFQLKCNEDKFEEALVAIDCLMWICSLYSFITWKDFKENTENRSNNNTLEELLKEQNFEFCFESSGTNSSDEHHFVELKFEFEDSYLARKLNNKQFTIQLTAPEASEIVYHDVFNDIKTNNDKKSTVLHNSFGNYLEVESNDNTKRIFSAIDKAIERLVSPDYLNDSFSYALLEAVVKQQKIKKLTVGIKTTNE